MSHTIFAKLHCYRIPTVALPPLSFLITFLMFLHGAHGQQAQMAPMPQKNIWAQARLAGSEAGYYHESETVAPDQPIVSLIENDLVFNREGSKVEIKSSSRYQESVDGRLAKISSEMSSSDQPTRIEATVEGSSLAIHITTGGKTYSRMLPLTADVLGPEAARRLIVSRLKSPGDEVSYQMFYPELGSVATITDKLVGRESVSVEGEAAPTLKLEQTMSLVPGKAFVWLDAQGWLVRQLTPTPFGDVETLRASKAEIEAADVKGAALPKEAFANTLVTSNIRLPEERLIEQLTIRITHKKPGLGWPDFSAENQRVLEMTPDHVVLEIRRVMPGEHALRALHATDQELAPFLQPNALLQSDDAAVQSIAAKVVGNDTDVYHAARSLQEWTNQNMKFDLGIAIASASEVARNRRGTCFGYAVLLASLARAEGIPSRIRMGFVYAGGIWGGHAWVEVLAGKDWVPLDSALYSPGPADAARFSFFTSGLQEGVIAQVGELAKLYGNVDIRILDYTIRGNRIVVPQDAERFSISGDIYQDPWLGLTVQKPKGFHFTQLTATWPESTVVGMQGPQQERVEIQSHSVSLPVQESTAEEELLRSAGITGTRSNKRVDGQQAVLISSEHKSGLVFKHGGEILLIIATGPGADQLLQQVASTVRLKH